MRGQPSGERGAADGGALSAEYAVGTTAVVAFAIVLHEFLTSPFMRRVVWDVVRSVLLLPWD